jgi:hypothetical protein
VSISEALFNPEGSDGDREFIELSGPPGGSALGLTLLIYRSSDALEREAVALRGTFDEQGLLLLGGAGVAGARIPLPAALGNTNTAYVVRGCNQELLDVLVYASPEVSPALPAAGAPADAPAEGQSLGRCPTATPTGDSAADFEPVTPSPGRPQAPDDFAPGSRCRTGPCDPARFDDIRLSEVLFDPDGSDTDKEFIEISMPPGEIAEILTVVVKRASDGAISEQWPLTGTAPDDGIVLLGGASLSPDVVTGCTSSCLPSEGAVQLWGCHGELVDALAWGAASTPALGEGTLAPDAGSGESLARCDLFADSGDNATDFVAATPTPGTAGAPECGP